MLCPILLETAFLAGEYCHFDVKEGNQCGSEVSKRNNHCFTSMCFVLAAQNFQHVVHKIYKPNHFFLLLRVVYMCKEHKFCIKIFSLSMLHLLFLLQILIKHTKRQKGSVAITRVYSHLTGAVTKK